MAWSFVVADGRGGRKLSELRRASDRKITFVLKRVPALTFNLPAAVRVSQSVTGLDKVLIRGYDDAVRNPDGRLLPRFQGPIIGFDKTRRASDNSVAVTAAGVEWRLLSRLIGKSANLAGPHPGKTYGTALAPIDRGEILRQVYVDAGGEATGITVGSIVPSNSTFAGPYFYKPAAEVFTEVGSGLDGVDWEVEPIEPVQSGTNTLLGRLNIAPAFGSVRSKAVFEFGTGKHNVAEWNHTGDSGGNLNQGFITPPGFPDAAVEPVVTNSDAASIADRGLFEGLIAADLSVADLRQQLVNDHVRVRRTPRETITFTPVRDLEPSDVPLEKRKVPRFGIDFDLGDVVPFRAVEWMEVYDAEGNVVGFAEETTVDALLRVYGVELSLDDAGVATPTLTLVDDS